MVRRRRLPSSRQAEVDLAMMRRALREARKGRPSPNPHVGAVLARGDQLLAVGHNRGSGEPHAVSIALAKAGARARGACLYVSLAPCNDHGRTGPCVDAILAAGMARVVVGCPDPTGHARGGEARLRNAGVEVVQSALRSDAEALIAPFSKHATTGLPWVVLKAAVTLDGHMAARTGDSKWITGQRARTEAHRLRAQHDAILVGVGTALADDPELTVRHVRGPNPLRVILDSRLRLPPSGRLAQGAQRTPTLVLHAAGAPMAKRQRLADQGVMLASVRSDRKGRVSVTAALRALAKRGVVSALVEGGPTLHGALWDARLVDRVEVFMAPRLLGDGAAPPMLDGRARRTMAEAGQLEAVQVRRLAPDIWIRGAVSRGSL